MLSRIRNHGFIQLLSIISLPVMFSILILFSCFFIYNNNYKEIIKNKSLTSLEHFCRHQDETIQNISLSISAMSENDRFVNTANGLLQSTSDITYTQKALRKIKLNQAMIDSISIYEKTSMRVYTGNNIYPAEEYFSKIFLYENYDFNFWTDYSSPLSEKVILPPCRVIDNSETEKNIIPVVFTRINDKYLKNIIIMNIDLTEIIRQYDSYKLSKNSTFWLINKGTKQLFGKDYHITADDDLYSSLAIENSNSFDYFTDRKNYVISYSPKRSALGYTYVSMIPYSDITHSTLKFTSRLVLIAFSALLILCLLIFIATKKAYSPFQKISSLFDTDNQDGSINSIHNLVASTLDANKNLSAELDNTLPILEEQYLIRLLNSSTHYYTGDLNLEKKISFPNKNFCSVIIRFAPKDSFYKKYNPLEEKNIELNLFEIIRQEFAANYKTYIIPSDEHTLYILLNPDSAEADEKIRSIIEYLQSLLKNDSEDIRLTIAYGEIAEGLTGLKNSHTKALRQLSGTQWISNLHVKTDSKQKKQILRFSQADETTIYNHIISGNIDVALELINNLIDFNVSQNVTKSGIMQLYVQIFNVLFKIMRAKKIEYDEEGLGDIGIISDIISHELDEVHSIMLSLIEKIRKYIGTNRLAISEVLEYIHKNYSKNESLEELSDHFGVSMSHLSRLIKKETASTFTDYINKLRINEAKQLLETTNNSLTSIYECVGFNNRNTFIRLFKQIVGTTPSEYRKNHNNNQLP